MPRFLTLLALTLALGLSTEQATALGFGNASGGTALGQPLGFTVGLRLDASDSIEAKCVKAEVSFGDRALPDALVRTRLERQVVTGERRLRISTTIPVDEPVVAIRVHLGCPAGLSRDFMVLADPPGVAAAPDARADDTWLGDRAETAVSPIVAAAAPAPVASAVPARNPSRRTPRGEPSASSSADRPAMVSSSRSAGEPPRPMPRPRSVAAPKPSRGSVLRLDPVDADEAAGPPSQGDVSASPLPVPAASGAASQVHDPGEAQRQQEQERLKAMEATLLQLRSDSQATQKALAEMQLRLRAAEAGRYANPLVYALTALCAVLGVGLLAMWWLRRRDRAVAAWWAAQPGARAAPEATAEASLASSPAPESVAPAPDFPVTPHAPLTPSPPAPPPPPPRRVPEPEAAVPEPRRPMSAEELIDLEQQAEFFVVLGQDDAAIDLLMGHVRSTGGVSPLPYLKLLEIYRRRGEREPYDRIRERFNRRFNAYAPEWDVDPEQGLNLEGYPEVMSRLQKAWDSPSQAMELLDGALFRRDAGPTFDVPAYRELLFLYSMARDLAERDVSPDGVDLLLPLGDDAPSTMTSVPASAASPAPLDEIGRFSLDLDVSTDQPPRLSLDDTDFKRSGR